MSSLEMINIGNLADANDHVSVAVRDEIIARLRQLPEILGMADSEIAEVLGISASLWSNYKSETTDVTIRPLVALELEKATGIPMAWIYGGLLDGVSNPQLRAKLATANRKAAAWLDARIPKRGNNRLRIALIMALGASLAWGWPSGMGHAKHAPTRSIVGDCRIFEGLACQHWPIM